MTRRPGIDPGPRPVGAGLDRTDGAYGGHPTNLTDHPTNFGSGGIDVSFGDFGHRQLRFPLPVGAPDPAHDGSRSATDPCRSPLPPGRSVATPHRSPSPRAGGARWHPPSSSPSARNGLQRLRHTGSQSRKNGHRYTYVNPHTEKRIMPFLCCSQGQSDPPSGSFRCSKANSIPHFPECNSAATQDPHLCSSKRPPSPLNKDPKPPCDPATLRPCDPATLRPCDPATLRPCDPATLRPCDPATLRPCDPATLRPCDPATLRPCDPATLRPCDPATLRPCDPATPSVHRKSRIRGAHQS